MTTFQLRSNTRLLRPLESDLLHFSFMKHELMSLKEKQKMKPTFKQFFTNWKVANTILIFFYKSLGKFIHSSSFLDSWFRNKLQQSIWKTSLKENLKLIQESGKGQNNVTHNSFNWARWTAAAPRNPSSRSNLITCLGGEV